MPMRGGRRGAPLRPRTDSALCFRKQIMPASLTRLGLLASAALWASHLAATAGDDESAPLEPGFRRIFNGRDLNGWHKNPKKIGHGTGGRWEVVDGAIVGQQDPPGSGNGGILLSDETFGDFEVMFETRPDWGPDSGFFMRSTQAGNCYQMMIDYHEEGNLGEIYREGLDGATNRTFSLAGVYADDARKVLQRIVASPVKPSPARQQPGEPRFKLEDWPRIWRLDDWNTIKCRVVGNPPTITTWINGTLITEYTSDKAFDGVLGQRGHLAFQVHGGTQAWPKGAVVRFRNVRVREL